MRTLPNVPVKVRLDFDPAGKSVRLLLVKWEGRTYRVRETGIAYSVRDGRKRVHVFCVNVGTLDMRVHADGDTLHASLIEVSDGLAD